MSQLLQDADIIPLDAAILGSAAAMEIAYGLSGQDAIVLASVLRHFEANALEESCFLNKNNMDFDDPDTVELEASRRDPYRQLSRIFHLVGRKDSN